jgi:hypothetical protein
MVQSPKPMTTPLFKLSQNVGDAPYSGRDDLLISRMHSLLFYGREMARFLSPTRSQGGNPIGKREGNYN